MHLTIKQKFYLVGALVFVSMLGIMGLGQYATTRLKQYSDVAAAIGDVRSGMLLLRRNEKDFLARKNNSYGDKFHDNYGRLQTSMETLVGTLDAAGLDAGGAIALGQTLERYRDNFDRVLDVQNKIGLSAKEGLYGQLREAVHAVEAEVAGLEDQRLWADMLQLRRDEKDFILRLDPKYLEKFKADMETFTRDLEASALAPEVKERIGALIQRYQQGFDQLAKFSRDKGLDSQKGLLGKMRETAHGSEAELQHLDDALDAAIADGIGSIERMLWTTNLIGFALVLGVLAVMAWIARGILGPIQNLVGTMTQAAAENDLSLRAAMDSRDEIGQAGAALNTMLEKFQNIVAEVNTSASRLNEATGELSAISQETSARVREQFEETEQVASAIGQVVTSVEAVSGNAGQAAEAATETAEEANEGQRVVEEAIATMKQLSGEIEQAGEVIRKLEQDSDNIGAVLDVIRGIAEQTNLLALNAAIEAARAGEQGRGFAVVADEVRTLASRTQESTQEIQNMIESLQAGTQAVVRVMDASRDRTAAGVERVAAAGQALTTITTGVARINEMNDQIVQATNEQNAVAAGIETKVGRISQLASVSADNAERTRGASETLSNLAAQLQELVSRFRA